MSVHSLCFCRTLVTPPGQRQYPPPYYGGLVGGCSTCLAMLALVLVVYSLLVLPAQYDYAIVVCLRCGGPIPREQKPGNRNRIYKGCIYIYIRSIWIELMCYIIIHVIDCNCHINQRRIIHLSKQILRLGSPTIEATGNLALALKE